MLRVLRLMDPNATYAELLRTDYSVAERGDAAIRLLVWLAADGFTPAGADRPTVIRTAENALYDVLRVVDGC